MLVRVFFAFCVYPGFSADPMPLPVANEGIQFVPQNKTEAADGGVFLGQIGIIVGQLGYGPVVDELKFNLGYIQDLNGVPKDEQEPFNLPVALQLSRGLFTILLIALPKLYQTGMSKFQELLSNELSVWGSSNVYTMVAVSAFADTLDGIFTVLAQQLMGSDMAGVTGNFGMLILVVLNYFGMSKLPTRSQFIAIMVITVGAFLFSKGNIDNIMQNGLSGGFVPGLLVNWAGIAGRFLSTMLFLKFLCNEDGCIDKGVFSIGNALGFFVFCGIFEVVANMHVIPFLQENTKKSLDILFGDPAWGWYNVRAWLCVSMAKAPWYYGYLMVSAGASSVLAETTHVASKSLGVALIRVFYLAGRHTLGADCRRDCYLLAKFWDIWQAAGFVVSAAGVYMYMTASRDA